MVVKIIGAACILGVCGGFGYYLAWQHLRDEQMLRQLMRTLEYMECELQYRLTPLPDLCRSCAQELTGALSSVFMQLSTELNMGALPNAAICMNTILSNRRDLPTQTGKVLTLLGTQLGRFDLNGQVRCLDSVKETCRRALEELSDDKQMYVRRYKTLGLCAGAALIIIFI